MKMRHWQVFVGLTTNNEAPHMQVIDVVPGSVLMPFGSGSAEAAMIIDAPTHYEATLFVRLAMLELALDISTLSVTEVDTEPGEVLDPLVFDDLRMVRAQSWARALARPIPPAPEPTDDAS